MYKDARFVKVQEKMVFQIWHCIENYFHYFSLFNGNSMNQVVRCRPVCPQAKFCTRFKICKICGVQFDKSAGLSLNTNFSPLSTNPPLFHTHPYLKTTLFRRTSGIIFPKSGNMNVDFFYCLWSAKHSYITVFWLLTGIFCQHLSIIYSFKNNHKDAPS